MSLMLIMMMMMMKGISTLLAALLLWNNSIELISTLAQLLHILRFVRRIPIRLRFSVFVERSFGGVAAAAAAFRVSALVHPH